MQIKLKITLVTITIEGTLREHSIENYIYFSPEIINWKKVRLGNIFLTACHKNGWNNSNKQFIYISDVGFMIYFY